MNSDDEYMMICKCITAGGNIAEEQTHFKHIYCSPSSHLSSICTPQSYSG